MCGDSVATAAVPSIGVKDSDVINIRQAVASHHLFELPHLSKETGRALGFAGHRLGSRSSGIFRTTAGSRPLLTSS